MGALTGVDDEPRLIERARGGDREAFGMLVDIHQDRLYHFVRRQSRDDDEAMDIAQEAFVKAWTKLALFRADSKFSTWLFTIAANECRSRHRSRKLEPVAIDDATMQVSDPHEQGAQATLESEELKASLHKALASLDSDYSQPLILLHFQGESYQSIADILSIPLGTVKTRIHRGHKFLAEKLRPLGKTETTSVRHASKGHKAQP
ncbi:MAG: RNA polymerase sigma factor [Planctomycetota bacterium]